MKLLLHTCCAPCLIYPLDKIIEKTETPPTIFFFNPNIHPYREFTNRLKTLKDFLMLKKLFSDAIIHEDYILEEFLKKILSRDEGVDRCRVCYHIRLSETANTAKQKGFDAFTTTLLVSPYQKHDLIHEVGNLVSREFNIEYVQEDWRNGFRQGREAAAQLNLYLQSYCGCIFSEEDRYNKKKNCKI